MSRSVLWGSLIAVVLVGGIVAYTLTLDNISAEQAMVTDLNRMRSFATLRLSSDGMGDHPRPGHRVLGQPTPKEMERVDVIFEGEMTCKLGMSAVTAASSVSPPASGSRHRYTSRPASSSAHSERQVDAPGTPTAATR